MNLVSWAGYWFYAATSSVERANLFSSYGLLRSAPSPGSGTPFSWGKKLFDWFWEFF